MYKGYIRLKNDTKEPMQAYANKTSEELMTLEEVQEYDSYAGVLEENVILVDYDDFEESEKAMDVIEALDVNCRVYETTRGLHFVFANNDRYKMAHTNKTSALGLNIDIKLGLKNSYQVLKKGGKVREIIWEEFEGEPLSTVPKWMLPVDGAKTFGELKEGDGRNQILFNYILTLQSEEFTKDEARETIGLINKYILSDPLPKDELETILRDESFEKEQFFGKNNKFHFNVFGTFLKNQHHIIKLFNELYIYNNGQYLNNTASIEYAMYQHIPTLRKSQRKEVLEFLKVINQHNSEETSADYILFRNGVLNIKTNELHPHDPKFIITNKIDWDYNPNAYDEVTDKTLDKMACNDEQVRELMEEMIGYTFYRRNELRKAFILTGEKNNGKSTFLEMIKYMLGEENYKSLDLRELGDRFKTAELVGKLANIGDDIDSNYISNTGIFKKLVTGESINVERKNLDPFDFKNYSKMLFSANSIPRLGTGKDSAAIMSRINIVPFDATFDKSDADFDPFIKDKLTTQQAIEYLIKLGVDALKRVLLNRSFTESNRVKKELDEYERTNNPLLGFVELYKENKKEISGQFLNDVYMKYQEYCINDGYEALSKNVFSRQLQQMTRLTTKRKTVDGKKVTYFTK